MPRIAVLILTASAALFFMHEHLIVRATAARHSPDSGTKPARRLFVQNRRKIRSALKVLHRHRIGSFEFRRLSELVYVRGKPKAVLGWIDVGGGVRTPIYLYDLDPRKLRKAAATPDTFYYEGVTVDPRYEDLATLKDPAPPPRGA